MHNSELSPPSRTRQAVVMAVRLGTAALVLGVGYWSVSRVRSLLNDPSPLPTVEVSVEPAAETTQPKDFADLAAALAGGRWEFVDGGWTLAVGNLPATELLGFWNHTPPQTVPSGAVGDWERSVLDLPRSFGLAAEIQGVRHAYRYDSPMLRAEITAEVRDGVERLISAQGVVRLSDDQYTSLETSRSEASGSPAARKPLLPYPAGTEVLAVRTDSHGRALGEFSRSPATLEQMLTIWNEAGCPIALDGAAGTGNFREGDCTNGGRTLHVVLWEPSPKAGTSVLALNTTGVAESSLASPQTTQP